MADTHQLICKQEFVDLFERKIKMAESDQLLFEFNLATISPVVSCHITRNIVLKPFGKVLNRAFQC